MGQNINLFSSFNKLKLKSIAGAEKFSSESLNKNTFSM